MTWDTATFLSLAIKCKFYPTEEVKDRNLIDSISLFCQLVLFPPNLHTQYRGLYSTDHAKDWSMEA